MEILGREPIDEIYTVARAAVEEETASRAQRVLDSEAPGSYGSGIRVVSFHLLDTHAPLEVHDAFRDVASAMEDRSAMVNQAQGFREERLHLARGEADRRVARATAEKSRAVLAAEGETAGFQSLLEAVEGTERLNRYRLYLESAERALPRANLYITPGDRSVGQFDLWLRSSLPEDCVTCVPENPAAAPVEEPNR
jgi:regulator of protease activity HflC (stomatin/prohibitin superfamily)